ncbi:GntR family transcriptional regulator [Enterococcus sp. 669A]|uniref:GntR family transcriptional regulator n=1 Tax=Candidatus Enterococcus moelleringii TaxID=2815325 RepID=A0ABS3L5U5_9ENTE|nr:GntR family transcriptional regulator [Enterococcus sp. 669A]MBO1304987.1 GntR family transcriptional regulator [Enterococcus sp. 669A]
MLKYMEIAADIERSIVEEDLKQGTKLPKFDELIRKYGVSKSTIVKALNILEGRGAIYQIQGSGVFVRRRNRLGYINMIENQGFTTNLDHFDITAKVLSLEKVLPDLEVKENLNCQEGEEVYHVKRIRYINEQILCVEESFFKSDIVTYLNEEIVMGSIFTYLNEALKLNIGFSDKYLHMIKLNEDNSPLLDLKPGDPGLFIEELFYLSSGVPFDFSRTVYHYEHSQFFVQSSSLNH